MSLTMNWKSTAVVSGAGLLVTWLAADPPLRPRGVASEQTVPSVARTEAAAADIQQQAARLHVRLEQVTGFRHPARNPFRFAQRGAPAPQHAAPAITVEPISPTPDSSAPPTFRMALAGIAEDTEGDQTVRTAIISTTDDVLLVKEGEQVGSQYKVVRILSDAVELARLDDGATVRLALRP